jgi:hypothetical protein
MGNLRPTPLAKPADNMHLRNAAYLWWVATEEGKRKKEAGIRV